MTDWRVHKSSGRVAHDSMRGQISGVTFTQGTVQQVKVPVADLMDRPDGALDRQLICGDGFRVLEDTDGYAFGFAEPSGYVGYVRCDALGDLAEITHVVATFGAHIYPTRSIKTAPVRGLPFGAGLTCGQEQDGFRQTEFGYVPVQQVQNAGQIEPDFAATALRFEGVPYLWGGDSHWGLDCSGLIHAALRLGGRDCPRDSDQQEAFFPAVNGDMQRGDLVFWKGHVGMLTDARTIVHANGHHMAVTVEPVADVVDRIQKAEGKEVTSVRRP